MALTAFPALTSSVPPLGLLFQNLVVITTRESKSLAATLAVSLGRGPATAALSLSAHPFTSAKGESP